MMKEIEEIIGRCRGDNLPYCETACPLQVDIKGYIALTRESKFDEALRLIKRKLPFPKIMGRICTHPCESKCKRQEVDEAIAIASLKRAAGDYAKLLEEDLSITKEKGNKVAIIGGGPAGLMAAHDLRKLGYQVTIFEALAILGGMLSVGIPAYRLPREILQEEISVISKLGVNIKLNTKVGMHAKFSEIRKNFDAIFIATGAHIGKKMGIENEDAEDVVNGVEFLRRVNMGEWTKVKERVLIVGGGNVAVDCARSCLRLGFKEVIILYRRSRAEMPAIPKEVEEAEKEGVEIKFLTIPIRVLTKNSKAIGIECLQTRLEELDSNGSKYPIPIESSNFVIESDLIISAIGQQPDLSFLKDEGIFVKDGLLCVDPLTLQTNVPGIFAGGDVVTGPATVIDALAAGRRAAISIDRYLRGEDLVANRESEGPRETRLEVSIEGINKRPRQTMPTLPIEKRHWSFEEVEFGFSKEEAKAEAERCLSCECRYCVQACHFLRIYCEIPKKLAEKFKAGYFREKPQIPYSCNLCGLCERLCPSGLNIGKMCLKLRQQLVEEGLAPLPSHQLVMKDQEWSLSDSFTLALPDLNTSWCDRVFFPGCNLSGYSPFLVLRAYHYLQTKLPGTGIILGCCGSPTRELGLQQKYQGIVKEIELTMKKLGASEMISACPNCYSTLREHKPWFRLRSIYEIIVELGLPVNMPNYKWTFSIHDPCRVRWEKDWQDAVRISVKRMGYQIEEMEFSRNKTRCCGLGGGVLFTKFDLALNIIKQRIKEAPYDILTYCASCREAFASQGKPSVHILDLIFNRNWDKDKLKPPNKASVKRENQSLLKFWLQSGKWKEVISNAFTDK